MAEKGEERFRSIVRRLLAEGRYPEHRLILRPLGRDVLSLRSGLTKEQSSWRIDEIEKAGYDWEASKQVKRLVRK